MTSMGSLSFERNDHAQRRTETRNSALAPRWRPGAKSVRETPCHLRIKSQTALLAEQGGAGLLARGKPAEKPSLVGATRAELAEVCRSLGVAERDIKMRTAQLWHWIYFQGATSFDVMLNLGKALRSQRLPKISRSRGPRSSPSRSRRTARANG